MMLFLFNYQSYCSQQFSWARWAEEKCFDLHFTHILAEFSFFFSVWNIVYFERGDNKKFKHVLFKYFSCVSFSSVYRRVIFISIKDDFLKYQSMECCGQTYSSNFALRRHVANKHTPSSGIYRCFAEKCRKNFRRKASFVQHQLTHHYISDEFHLMTQAFQGVTLILRRNLRDQGIYGLDFLLEPQTILEISKILNSEVCKKNQLFLN